MGLIIRGNDALDVNPPQGDQYLSVHGSDWLWAVTAVYAITFLLFVGLTFTARAGERIFHHIFTIALLVGAIAYYAQASDLGWSAITQANNVDDQGALRQIFFAKYVNWVVSFPAAILALGLLSGVSWTTIAYNIFLAWTWIISFLVGAYTLTNYKWGFFVFGVVAWLLLGFSTLIASRSHASRVGVSRDHTLLAGWINFLWLLYPIAWGLSDGGNRIGVTGEFIFFGVLDVLFLPVLALLTLWFSRSWDYGKMNIAFTQYGRVRAGADYPEKPVGGTTAGVAGPPGGPATTV